MNAEDLRRWVTARRTVEELERVSADRVADPALAWRQALSLFALVGRMIAWPVEPDDIRRREDEAAAQAWARLRANYGPRT